MKRIYIWGAGHYIQQVVEEVDRTKADILGVLDNDEKKQGKKLFHIIPIISPLKIVEKEFDYVVISVKDYVIIENECKKMGIEEDKIITYWRDGYKNCIFKKHAERIEELMEERKRFQIYLDSVPYEWGAKEVPQIKKGTELLRKILKDHSSLCRFGDGEFEMIRRKARPWFQQPDYKLSERLREVLHSKNDSINIAIAQNFKDFDAYKENAADCIREYMFGDTRKYILELIDKERIYYDAYVSRPYIIYKDKKNADEIFPLFKEIWKEKNVVFVEGEYSRIGIGNDLIDTAASVRRILCPSKNAWNKYEEIFSTIIKNVPKQSLLCISLGPCATVLAYDLAIEGYQAIDIGQLDNEYEWYLQGAEERTEIPGKMVAEVPKKQKLELRDEKIYREQIIAEIL